MPAKSHVFFIKSYLNGLCLDIEGGEAEPGARVIMYEAKDAEDAENQLWYLDATTHTIRSVLNDCCLEVDGDHAWVNEYDPGNIGQRWSVSGQLLLNMEDGKCLDVVGNNQEEGADVCGWERHGQVNQRWYFEHVPRRYFYIESRLHGKVIDIEAADAEEGTKVCLWEKHEDPSDNQLWYAGRDGLIRSKLNGFVLDASEEEVRMRPLNIRSRGQGFSYSNGRLVNLHDADRVIDIIASNEDDGANLCEWDYHGGNNQLWHIRYIKI